MTPSAAQNHHSQWLRVTYLIVFLVAAGARLIAVERQGLWADEIFSLAMATGHSLEHSASHAKPELGDYIEAPHPRPAAEYQQYLQHQEPPAGIGRVLRAVYLSDTSPPLYYVLLWAWTRVGGTSDFAVHLFSVSWALACFPLMWSLARQFGGSASILPAGVLFALSPIAIYYSVEGRMYAMLWFLTLSLIWLTLKLHERGPRPVLLGFWIFVAAAGLLTHYFYIFVVAACGLWFLLHPGRFRRLVLLAAVACIAVLIAPWYSRIPDSLSLWRVTGGSWLYPPTVSSRSFAALTLPWNFVSPSSGWWPSDSRLTYVGMAVFSILVLISLVTLRLQLFTERRQLLWICLGSTCLGLLVFDRVMGTYTTAVSRYALAGLPAAFLLLAFALARLHPWLRTVFIVLILAVWLPSSWTIITSSIHGWEPYRELASMLERIDESDVVVVHSIPSGVLGVARYTQKPVLLFSWVHQLKQRHVPEDLERLLARGRIILVRVHEAMGGATPEQLWLQNHAQVVSKFNMNGAQILVFKPDISGDGHTRLRPLPSLLSQGITGVGSRLFVHRNEEHQF